MCDANWFSIAWKSSLRGGNERKKKTVGFGIPAERWMQMSREVWESHYLSAWLAGLLVGCYFHLFHGRLCCSAIVAQLLLSPDWYFFLSFSDTKLETRFLIFSQSSTSFSLPSGHNRSPQPKKNVHKSEMCFQDDRYGSSISPGAYVRTAGNNWTRRVTSRKRPDVRIHDNPAIGSTRLVKRAIHILLDIFSNNAQQGLHNAPDVSCALYNQPSPF